MKLFMLQGKIHRHWLHKITVTWWAPGPLNPKQPFQPWLASHIDVPQSAIRVQNR